MGVRFDERGITIRNFFRIYRFGWGEVRRFRDGLFQQSGEGGTIYFWVLTIQLHDGRDVTAKGTARKNGPRSQTLAAIRQAAERHSIPAALTGIAMRGGSPANPGLYPDPGGQPELRRWDGEEWSPLLEPDPASSVPRTAQRALEVYSPLSGSEQKWHDAAAKARRATIWFAICLVATAGATAGTLALIARNADGELTVLAALAALTTLCAAGTCRQSRSKFREIDQAAKTARDTFDTRQQTLGVADH